jgi:transglutaminase-like putative cysteine protease
MSEDKTIRGNALNMATIEKKDAFRLARYLNSNLYFTVKTMPLFTLLNSLETFHERFGDYLQRTVMFASFGRAAGLPVRLVGGLVYRDGYFYFHTWPEVWFGKWIPMEPTLAQFPADVTHIPLKEGTLQEITSMVKEMQSLSIEVLEAS